MKFRVLKMYLDPDGGQGGDPNSPAQNQSQQTQQSTPAQAFDYEKLAGIIAGKQTVAEDTVLKSYFKQQGLSQDEAQQAMAAFKAEKAKNTPDPTALQTQVTQAQQQAQQALIERDAYLLSGELGVDLKTMPYLLKMADLSAVVGTDGKVSQDSLKDALNKVLGDLPQLKQQTQQAAGFRFGASGGTGTETAVDEQLNRIFGVKSN